MPSQQSFISTMTAKKVMKLYQETVEISGEPGPDGFADMTLAEKRKNLIAFIKELTGGEEDKTAEAANDSTEEATPVADEPVVEEVDGTVTLDAENETVAVSDKQDKGSEQAKPEPEAEKKTAESPKQEDDPAEPAKAEDKPVKADKKKPKEPEVVVGTSTPVTDPNDPIQSLAKHIETINDPAVLEKETLSLLQSDKVNEFQLGAQFFSQVQQSGFVFDDFVGSIQHCGLLSFCGWFAPPSK